mmetsp:Transcript_96563/g.277952  ORF Transcript_96563/g.277952 Transcript_96563/m.277952 type:complete len:220 (-) Transcript_96563:57-716(-)
MKVSLSKGRPARFASRCIRNACSSDFCFSSTFAFKRCLRHMLSWYKAWWRPLASWPEEDARYFTSAYRRAGSTLALRPRRSLSLAAPTEPSALTASGPETGAAGVDGDLGDFGLGEPARRAYGTCQGSSASRSKTPASRTPKRSTVPIDLQLGAVPNLPLPGPRPPKLAVVALAAPRSNCACMGLPGPAATRTAVFGKFRIHAGSAIVLATKDAPDPTG